MRQAFWGVEAIHHVLKRLATGCHLVVTIILQLALAIGRIGRPPGRESFQHDLSFVVGFQLVDVFFVSVVLARRGNCHLDDRGSN